MIFSDGYMARHSFREPSIAMPPHPEVFLSVVIPCCDEPRLNESLESLLLCNPPKQAVEVVVVVNHSGEASPEIRKQNIESIESGRLWATEHSRPNLQFHFIEAFDLPARHAGVGLARKIGMDEAVRRFGLLNRPEGLIAGFDADSTCRPNYLQVLEERFYQVKKIRACSIYYEHPLQGEYSPFIYEAIASYELYLRFFIHAQRWAGYPLAFQTIGSSFAVRACEYARVGGMNRQKAGEDFYFLQKLIPLGGFFEINETVVYPSPRPSRRVPFGTGAAIEKMMESALAEAPCYQWGAFELLRDFFEIVSLFFSADQQETDHLIKGLAPEMEQYLRETGFPDQVQEIRENSGSLQAFRKRFFQHFGAFRIMKFLNAHHPEPFTWHSPRTEAILLLDHLGIKKPGATTRELLKYFRQIDRESAYSA